MKYLCEKCKTFMLFIGKQEDEAGSMRIVFECPQCKNQIAMLTNPHETQLVHNLGVTLGGPKEPNTPLELLRSTLVNCQEPIALKKAKINTKKQTNGINWTEEAEARIKNVPPILFKMVKKIVERYACENNYPVITPEVVEKAKKSCGMMDDFPFNTTK